MKAIFLILLLVIGLIIGNLFAFQNACRVKSPSDVISNEGKINEPEIPSRTLSQQIQWKPSAYLGITPGKSTYKNVIKLLGKPKGDQNPEGWHEEETGEVISLSYRNGENESFDVIIDGQTKIVYSITVYNNPRPTKQEIIARYGDEHFKVNVGNSTCITRGQEKEISVGESPDNSFLLVFPEKGVVASVDKSDKTMIISYSSECGYF